MVRAAIFAFGKLTSMRRDMQHPCNYEHIHTFLKITGMASAQAS